jgi:methylthioribose-1-phosphate isomerase
MKSGDDIVIEQRDAHELLADCYLNEASLISAWNPVFDVTPAHLITAIVTEKGVVLNPNEKGMNNLR